MEKHPREGQALALPVDSFCCLPHAAFTILLFDRGSKGISANTDPFISFFLLKIYYVLALHKVCGKGEAEGNVLLSHGRQAEDWTGNCPSSLLSLSPLFVEKNKNKNNK